MSVVRLMRADAGAAAPVSLLERARALDAQKQARIAIFEEGAKAFDGAAWDILLELFIAQEMGNLVLSSEARSIAGLAPTIAARWFAVLEQQELIHRRRHPREAGAWLLGLSPKGEDLMRRYLDQV